MKLALAAAALTLGPAGPSWSTLCAPAVAQPSTRPSSTGSSSAGAPAPVVTVRIGSLAPRGSSWMRVFDAWNRTLQQQTDGRLRLRFYPGGIRGDEVEMVDRIRAGELDGATLTSIGLGRLAPQVLLLQAPGVVRAYQELDRVRDALRPDLERYFEQAGVRVLGWGDVGQGRIFSTRPIQHPRALAQTKPWVWREDPILGAMMDAAGVRGVELRLPEVLPALSRGRVDTLMASATAVSALQWHTRLTHVSAQAFGVLIGATVLSARVFDQLSPEQKRALLSTGERTHRLLRRRMREQDDRYFRQLTGRHGLIAVDTAPARDAWRGLARRTREKLVGRVFPRQLLQRMQRAARAAAPRE